jgi:transcriptional regulator with XRE-family HTH domain
MTTNTDAAVERLRLRTELRTLRKDRGETQADVATAMDWSLSKLIRIEKGDVGISPGDVRELLAHFGVTDTDLIDSMTGRARVARRYPWSDLRAYYSPAELTYFAYESAASTIRSFELSLVNGLLQTKNYARAILADVYGEHWDVFDRRWQARERRQELHRRTPAPAMSFVLDEAVVRRVVGDPAIMREQLEQLVHWGAMPHVDLRVLPFGAGAHHGMHGPFILLGVGGEDDPDLLFKEGVDRTSTSTEDPAATRSYGTDFRMLQAQSLSPDDTTDLLKDLITGLS